MEFPNTGDHCSMQDCKQLDFLPFVCEHCQATFCKSHLHTTSHKCPKFVDNVKETNSKSTNYLCSHDSCKETSPIEMLCVICKKHFCLPHRYHGCLEVSGKDKTKKLKKWQIPKRQFAEAKAVVNKQISDSLRKSKNVSMAKKIQLMRVKSSAIGPRNVPIDERFYFLVYTSLSSFTRTITSPQGVYVNMNWTVGKTLDVMFNVLNLPNLSNISTANSLHLFHHSTGKIICEKMNVVLKDLSDASNIVNGQSVILEYSNSEYIDPSVYN